MRDHGVSLRLKGVQVVKYVPMQKANPFGSVEGFTVGGADNPFTPVAGVTVEEMEETTADVFGEEVAEVEAPPKKKAKKKETPKPKDDDDLSSLIDAWDDE